MKKPNVKRAPKGAHTGQSGGDSPAKTKKAPVSGFRLPVPKNEIYRLFILDRRMASIGAEDLSSDQRRKLAGMYQQWAEELRRSADLMDPKVLLQDSLN